MRASENKITLTVASFNIGAAQKNGGKFSPENMALVISAAKKSGADIIGMQEVDRGCGRSHGTDMPAEIAAGACYPFSYFIKIRDFQGGEYGTLILSKYPIIESKTVDYVLKTTTWGTSCGWARLDVKGRTLTVFNTHLSCQSDEGNTETMTELERVIGEYRTGHPDEPVICMGDFNEFPEKLRRIIPEMQTTAETEKTYKWKTIDNILRSEGVEASDVHTVDTVSDGTSDHNMLLCNITF
ncbi:MAG: endonuclease/exonuclease/phosphatase family protein [Clostridia bacterium]|nr:endonuclease/exonuclease/phosphatase family protein [Clostridia bacterium]